MKFGKSYHGETPFRGTSKWEIEPLRQVQKSFQRALPFLISINLFWNFRRKQLYTKFVYILFDGVRL
jgi:hypothetical protein